MRSNFSCYSHAATKALVKVQVETGMAAVVTAQPVFAQIDEIVIATLNAAIDAARDPGPGEEIYANADGMMDSWTAGSPPPIDQIRFTTSVVVAAEL
jgi:hypothetical protein